MKIIVSISFILLLFVNNIYGQRTYTPEFSDPILDKYRWQHCEELSDKNFSCFCEDKDGTMWFGVHNAVMSFDGYSWKEYPIPEDKGGNGYIRAMAFLGDTLFVGGNGMQTLVNGSWSNVKHEVGENQFFADMRNDGEVFFRELIVSEDVLIGPRTAGLYIRKNGKEHFYTNETIKQRFDTIFTDLNFHVLPNFGEGINFYCSDVLDCGNNTYYAFSSYVEKGKNHFKFELTDNEENPLKIINEDRKTDTKTRGEIASLLWPNGDIWVVSRTYLFGLNILRNNEWEMLSFKDELNESEISTDILKLSDGSVLITSMGVIYRYYQNKWTKIAAPDISFESYQLNAHFSKNGDLWLGDERGEVYLIDYDSKHYTTYRNLNYQFTNTDGSLWFISNDEKVVFEKDSEWYYYDAIDGLPEAPQTLYVTKNGTIWCGGSHNQVSATAYLQNNKWIKQIHDSLSWSINYNAVTEDNDGWIWFGGAIHPKIGTGQLGGLVKIRKDGNNINTIPYYIDAPAFFSFAVRDDNRVYAGTGIGLLSFYKGKPMPIDEGNYIVYNNIIKTTTGSFWMATRGKGVIKYFGDNKQKIFGVKDGLSTNVVFDVYPANDTSVWAATNKGYFYYNGHYWRNDIYPDEFNIGIESGKLSGHNRNVWISQFPLNWTRRVYEQKKFVTEKNNFYSVMCQQDTMPPETKITFYNQQVDASGYTNIAWSGIDYMQHTKNEKLLYSYRLNNQEWSIPTKQTNINFLDLKSGDYIFEVKAFDNNNNFDPSPAKVSFIVALPVWKQSWFIAMILFFIGALLFMATRIILRNKKLAVANSEIEKSKQKIYQQNLKLVSNSEHLEHVVEERTHELKKAKLKAEESVKLKSAFLANMSHEIRTPMNAIIGFSRILGDEEINQNERKEYLKIIISNSESLLVLLDDIIDISLIEADQITINKTNFDLNTLFVELERNALLKKKTDADIILLRDNMQDTLMISSDPIRLKQVISNLLNNAIKFTEKGSVKFGYKLMGKQLRIFVSDTGIGIKEENFENIFNHFYKIEDTKKIYRGTGIGLSICKKIVELMNGKIWVESELDKGTTFYVDLPIDQ